MKHYVCPECGYTTQTSSVCQTDFCLLQGVALKECSCTNGHHHGILHKDQKADDNDDVEDIESAPRSRETLDLDA